ncbi:GAP family protein [Streptomyces sp. NBC_01525]
MPTTTRGGRLGTRCWSCAGPGRRCRGQSTSHHGHDPHPGHTGRTPQRNIVRPRLGPGLAPALSAANLKNAPLTIAAGASISSAGIPVPQQIGTLAVCVSTASLGVLTPLTAYLIMGERAKSMLSSWQDWAVQHHVAVMAVLFFVLGLKLFGDGISILAT